MLRPRWLGWLAVVLVLMATFTWLGFWQLGVAQAKGRQDLVDAARTIPPVPLDELLTPQGQFPGDKSSRRVIAVGRYDAAGQVVVVDRRLGSAMGGWVITPLVVQGTGAYLAVLRGFTTTLDAPPPTTTGTVTVVGSIAPAESPVPPAGLPAGRLGSVDLAALANQWPGRLYNAFVFAISETPSATAVGTAPGQLQRVPPPSPSPGLAAQNFAYAIQWWLFALFALWMWWKMVGDDHHRELADGPPDGPSDDPPDDPPGRVPDQVPNPSHLTQPVEQESVP